MTNLRWARAAALSSAAFTVLSVALAGCSSDDGVSSSADAERAYVGLDTSIDTAITLGFQGFNAASSANIDTQTANGKAGGTLTVSGQVDQGASSNKTMNRRCPRCP